MKGTMDIEDLEQAMTERYDELLEGVREHYVDCIHEYLQERNRQLIRLGQDDAANLIAEWASKVPAAYMFDEAAGFACPDEKAFASLITHNLSLEAQLDYYKKLVKRNYTLGKINFVRGQVTQEVLDQTGKVVDLCVLK